MSPETASVKTREPETTGTMVVASNVNSILRALMDCLKQVDGADIRLGRAAARRDGWKASGYAVHARVRGAVNGDVVFGVSPMMARQMARQMLSKHLDANESALRLAVQMLANEALVASSDLLSQVNIRVSLSAPRVYSRFEWSRTPMSHIPMIEIPLGTAFGVCQLAFNIRS